MNRDLIKEAVTLSLRGLDELVATHGWDQTPSLWGIYRNLGAQSVLFEFEPLLQSVFANDRPTDTLADLADAADQNAWLFDELQVFGLAFVSEAWMVAGRDPLIDEGVSPELHPARREVRIVAAVDLAGICYLHTMDRLTAERTEHSFDRRDSASVEEGGGYVLDSLSRLMKAVI